MNTVKSIAAGFLTVYGLYMYIGLSPELDTPWSLLVGLAGVVMSLEGLDWKIRMAIRSRTSKPILPQVRS